MFIYYTLLLYNFALGSDSDSTSARDTKQLTNKAIDNENTERIEDKIEKITEPMEIVEPIKLLKDELNENSETASDKTAFDGQSNEEEISSEAKTDIDKKNE